MNLDINISELPASIRSLLTIFLLAITFGYVTGAFFLRSTEQVSPQGIEENYLGNEDNEDAEVMKFKKSEGEVLTTVHTHAFSLSVMFLILSFMIYFAKVPSYLKKFLMIEPLLSVILTFGGLWLLWSGISWMIYIVVISGTLMHLSYAAIVSILFWQLTFGAKGAKKIKT